QRAVYAM
ncbi:hypothetical protein EC960932_4087, partial [Escherichia coli 96.0932]